jgi:hypothetical protein
MQQNSIHRFFALCLMCLLVMLLLTSILIPIIAQDAVFATNTPAGTAAESLFATNTAPAVLPTGTPLGPSALLFNYGLRIWLEADLVDLAFQQVIMIEEGDKDAQNALNLTLYELEFRFPGAPRRIEQRRNLIAALMNAPVGVLDMRSVVRPFIEDAINAEAGSMSFNVEGFDISLSPANLNNRGELDRVVHIRFERDGSLLYDEFLLAITNEDSSLSFLPTNYDLFAAPFAHIQSVELDRIADVNDDSLDELVLRVDDGQTSQRLMIIGQRNGQATDLVISGEEIRLGELVSWPVGDATNGIPQLRVLTFRADSAYPDWPCLSQIEYIWSYDRNLYRRSEELNARFKHVNSLGCTMLEAEPLFALTPEEAIAKVENTLLLYGFNSEGSSRALLSLSMLYVLTGRLTDAQNTAQSVIPADNPESWETRQATALLRATGSAGNTALDICQAMAQAVRSGESSACDMNSVLGRYLASLTLRSDQDLIEQLDSFGLPVLEHVTVKEAGRADRIVVSFLLADTDWWGFYEKRDGTYGAEPANAPAGFAEAIFPVAQVQAPQAAYNAFFVDNNPSHVLNILDNVEQNNPDLPFTPDALLMRALSYEITGSREEARTLYYEIWQRYPDSIWGLVASQHLEQR